MFLRIQLQDKAASSLVVKIPLPKSSSKAVCTMERGAKMLGQKASQRARLRRSWRPFPASYFFFYTNTRWTLARRSTC